jgi:hypothetical protein
MAESQSEKQPEKAGPVKECGNCKHYRPEGPTGGTCRESSPQSGAAIKSDLLGDKRWPRVMSTDFCSKWLSARPRRVGGW